MHVINMAVKKIKIDKKIDETRNYLPDRINKKN